MKSKEHLAHIATIDGQRVNQTIKEHSRAAAMYAGQALESIGLYNTGYLAALTHDIGKAKREYSEYLEKSQKSNVTTPQLFMCHLFGCNLSLNNYFIVCFFWNSNFFVFFSFFIG